MPYDNGVIETIQLEQQGCKAGGDASLNALAINRAFVKAAANGGLCSITRAGTYRVLSSALSLASGVTLIIGPNVRIVDSITGLSIAGIESAAFRFGAGGAIAAAALGVMLDGRIAQDAACTSGSPVITSTNIAFVASDVGKQVAMQGIDGTTPQLGKILSVVPGASCTIDSNCNDTYGSAYLTVASDVTAPLIAALAVAKGVYSATLMNSGPTTLELPAGTGCITAGITIPDGVRLLGQGYGHGSNGSGGNPRQTPAMEGTSLVVSTIGGLFNGTIAMTLGILANTPGQLGQATIGGVQSRVEEISIDAMQFLATTVQLTGFKATLYHVRAQGGFNQQVVMGGGDGRVLDCNIIGTGIPSPANSCIVINHSDCQVKDSMIFGWGGSSTGGVKILSGGSTSIVSRNHFYQYSPLVGTLPGTCVLILLTSTQGVNGIQITDNVIESAYGNIVACSAANTSVISMVEIGNNRVFQVTGFPDNTNDFVNLFAAAGAMNENINIHDNIINGFATADFRSILGITGPAQSINLTNNQARQTRLELNAVSVIPGIKGGNSWSAFGSPTVVNYSHESGVTQSPAFSATPTWNLNLGTKLTPAAMTAAITAITLQNIPPAGISVSIYLTQDSGGPYNVTWPATVIFPTAWVNPAVSASQKCLVTFVSDGTNLVAQGLNNWHV